MHLPGRFPAHPPLGWACSTIRPPTHARARGPAAWAAIRGSLGRALGRHRKHGAVRDNNSPEDGTGTSAADISRHTLQDPDLTEALKFMHKQIRDMLKTHSSMWDGTLSVIGATEHAIVTPSDALFIRTQPNRAGPFERQVISDQIKRMLKLNAIASSHSAWASPVVILPRRTVKAQFCVDYGRLNNIAKTDACSSPRMENCLDSSGDVRVFLSLHCTAEYWQVPLRKGNQEKPAFTTHCGIYHWLYIPLGLKNAPETFQRALDIILCGLK